ncbi:MAG: hypothetical protein ACQR33_01595 [Candidatus Saccharibacteria bacterium]
MQSTHDLAIQKLGTKQQDISTVEDITYKTASGRLVSAYVVMPEGEVTSGSIFMHWLDSASHGDRNEFLDEAVQLAKSGVASILLQGSFPWNVAPKDTDHDLIAIQEEVAGIQDSIAVLESFGLSCDAKIAYVGHDYGALLGINFVATTKRIMAAAFMAPTMRFSDWNVAYWLTSLTAEERIAYDQTLVQVDPLVCIEKIKETKILLQFGSQDVYVADSTAAQLTQLAGESAETKKYDAGHGLNDEAKSDRVEWILARLVA